MSEERIYAVGDIHGHLDKLIEVHDRIDRDRRAFGPGPIVHVGDLVDRGPDSKGVLDYLIDGIEAGEDWLVLKGNHDRMMLYYLQETPRHDPCLKAEFDWQHPRLGGWETLASYGIDMDLPQEAMHLAARAAVPAEHREFLADLPLWHRSGGLLFVHAGIRPGIPLDAQREDDLVWIRDPFLYSRADHGVLVIHGHTPVEEVVHLGNRIDIDTGAAFGGPLSAIVIEDGVVHALTRKGRRALVPPQR